jgi:hypothetical protein
MFRPFLILPVGEVTRKDMVLQRKLNRKVKIEMKILVKR